MQSSTLFREKNRSHASYYLNKEKTLARFYPTNTRWEKKLTSINYFLAPVFLNQGLCFKGEVNLERFLDAMHESLQDFDFLFSQLHRNDGDLYASYSTEDGNNSFIQLEIETKQETINASSLASITPNKVDKKIHSITANQSDDLPMPIVESFTGMPMVAFKLTTFIEGFAIGCYWNHALLDQSSMVYFFKYLSQVYSFGRDGISLQKPNLVDIDSLSSNVKSAYIFKSVADFRERSEAIIGFKYTPPKTDTTAPRKTDKTKPPPKLESHITVDLNFKLSEINKLKSKEKQYLSVNDIIHAVLLKIYSFNPDLPLDKNFCFGFVCNMRKYCELGEETIGNIISHPLIRLTLKDIKSKNLLELALCNRQCVSNITLELFQKSLGWYTHIQAYNENPLHYNTAFDSSNARVTNWTSFDYRNIQFDSAYPIELKTPCFASSRVNIISFDTKENEKQLKTSVSISRDSLHLLNKLESDSKLFVSERRTPIKQENEYQHIDDSVLDSASTNLYTPAP